MSTETTLIYDTPNQNEFAHTVSEILIDGTGATLKEIPLAATEAATAIFNADLTLTRAVGLTATTPVGGASYVSLLGLGYLDLRGGVLGDHLVIDTGNSLVADNGCVRLKYTPDYTTAPASVSTMYSQGASTGSSNSYLELLHHTDGTLRMTAHSNTSSLRLDMRVPFVAVSGTEVEIEANYDFTTLTFAIYINGVEITPSYIFSSAITGWNAITFNRLGADKTAAGSSCDGLIRDFQLFTDVQHTANFTSEVPRIVSIYPLESRIEPAQVSVAEGFFSAVDVKTLAGASDVRYTLKIENNIYWYNGGVVISDGSLAQSNSLATLTANALDITAFISSGASIILQPILSSGPLGLHSPQLVSTTILYNFFALPVSCTDCVLYGFIKDNCEAITSGTVRVRTTKPILTQGNVITIDETVAIDPTRDGYFDIELVIPNFKTTSPELASGSQDTYLVEIKWILASGGTKKVTYTVLIPNATSVLLSDAVALADALS